jgi:hypothetical protein
MLTIDTVHAARQVTLAQAFREHPERFVKKAANAARQTNRRMDQPASPEKHRLTADPGLIEVIKTFRAFLRPGIVTVSPISAAICSTPYGPAPLRSVT